MGDKDQDRTHPTGQGQTGAQTGMQTGRTWDQDGPRDPKRDSTDLEQGDRTRPAQPDGTTPLERDQQPTNQKR